MSDAWLKQQEEVWGTGDAFRRLVDSIHARNDNGPLEGDRLAERLASSGKPAGEVVNELLDWATAEMWREPAVGRARERFNDGWSKAIQDFSSGDWRRHGGRHLLWTVVNGLLRGPYCPDPTPSPSPKEGEIGPRPDVREGLREYFLRQDVTVQHGLHGPDPRGVVE